MVASEFHKLKVGGSNPPPVTKFVRVPKWFKGLVCKTSIHRLASPLSVTTRHSSNKFDSALAAPESRIRSFTLKRSLQPGNIHSKVEDFLLLSAFDQKIQLFFYFSQHILQFIQLVSLLALLNHGYGFFH